MECRRRPLGRIGPASTPANLRLNQHIPVANPNTPLARS
jgi:hypothetical protein